MAESISYKDAGVNIDEGNRAVKEMKKHVAKTWNKTVLNDLATFAGMVELTGKYEHPVLVSGTDGVGTKLKIAFQMDRHDTVGIDLVAMSVNDVLVHGAKPLFFLDYIGTGKVTAEKIEEIVKGVAEGCLMGKCALVGGETAELPSMYSEGEYDLAGFAVGIIEKDRIITGEKIKEGDVIFGLPSSGLHSNGFSLARKVLLEAAGFALTDKPEELGGKTVGEVMLTPTRIYTDAVMAMVENLDIHGLVHITGGGLIENVPRILPENLSAQFDRRAWDVPAVFPLIQKWGNVEEMEMYKVFNMGIGMCVIVDQKDAEALKAVLTQNNEPYFVIGEIVKGNKTVLFREA